MSLRKNLIIKKIEESKISSKKSNIIQEDDSGSIMNRQIKKKPRLNRIFNQKRADL